MVVFSLSLIRVQRRICKGKDIPGKIRNWDFHVKGVTNREGWTLT